MIAFSAFLTAIATIAIATFNFFLWRLGSGQLKELTKQVTLAREEFISTHRPRVRVRAFEVANKDLPHGNPIRITFLAQNIGETSAHLTELKACLHIARTNDTPLPTNLGFPYRDALKVTLRGGQSEALYIENGTAPSEENAAAIYADNMPLFCIGVIAYNDDSGTKRETGFCRRFHFRPYSSEAIRDSEYEYEY